MFDPRGSRALVAKSTLPPATRATPEIALIGNFLPRLCGIATFTTHLHEALRSLPDRPAVDVYAMVDPGRTYDFPAAVTMPIDQEDRGSYRRAAWRIQASGARLVWVQHEYGIFGGPAGEYLFDLLDAVPQPVVATLHTVLEAPNDDQRRVLDKLAARASLLIVMAERARTLLQRVYRVPASKIAVIEHGVPDRGYVSPSAARQCFGAEDRKTIMTFGLLSPDKGIENMIRAMPAILARCPEAIYRIVGATHPHLVAHEGERHRENLQALARELGVDTHLRWENRFLDEDQLLDRLATADVYVTPYRNPQQITSGTLSYAAALGKPIVSTPYIHATELLADARGVLVDFDDPRALGDAVGGLLTDDATRERLAARAFAHGRALTWRRMAERARARFAAIALAPATQKTPLRTLPMAIHGRAGTNQSGRARAFS
ncbi:glycosyltransferase family 4 protein [Sphingomonas sp. MMS24-J13]|uniref:glycosyltransferase family 4 protein n=1 Tax=Sphingomonas sp. MMS24-J13 TaxID=3238686 RepID=UPI00384B52F0